MAASIRVGVGDYVFTDTASTNTPSTTVQTSIAANDVLVLCVANSGTNTISGWPSGFTEITPASTESIFGSTMQVATKVATGLESGSFALTTTGFDTWKILSFTVTGVSTTLAASKNNGANGSFGTTVPLTGGSVATGASGNFVVFVGTGEIGGGNTVSAYTQPSGFASRATHIDAGGNIGTLLADFTEPSAGSVSYSGSLTSGTGSPTAGHTSTLVFTPTGGGGGSATYQPMQYQRKTLYFI